MERRVRLARRRINSSSRVNISRLAVEAVMVNVLLKDKAAISSARVVMAHVLRDRVVMVLHAHRVRAATAHVLRDRVVTVLRAHRVRAATVHARKAAPPDRVATVLPGRVDAPVAAMVHRVAADRADVRVVPVEAALRKSFW